MRKSPIIYSTAISDKIRSAYNYWVQCLDKHGKCTTTSAAYINFTNACEKEGRDSSATIDKLLAES